MTDRERKRVPDHRTGVLKGSLPHDPPAHPKNTEYPRLSEESEKDSRDKATRRGMEELYQRQRGSRWELFWIKSGFCLITNGDRRVKEWWGRFRSFADEASWAVGHSLNCIKENLRRASKESITIIKPGGNKRGNEIFSGFKTKKYIVWLNGSAWSPGKRVDRVCSPVLSMQADRQNWHQSYEMHWKMGW